MLPSARRAVPHWQHTGRRAGPRVPPLPATPNTTAPLSHPAEDTCEKVSRKAAELGECSRGPQWGSGICDWWLGSSGHPHGLTSCSRCHRYGGGAGQPLLPTGPCPTPGLPSARHPLPDLPTAAPPCRAARPLCPAVLQGAGACLGGCGGCGCCGASCAPAEPWCLPCHLSPQLSHLFNVAHTLRMLVQKERSLDILKVSRAQGGLPVPWAPRGSPVPGGDARAP